MTDDYKEKLLRYLTGKLSNESGLNEPKIDEVNELENNILSFVRESDPSFTGDSITINTLFTRNDYIILCCSLWQGIIETSFVKAYIVVLDKNYNPIKYIDKYSSGTPLNLISEINKYDEGTGRIYCRDNVYENGSLSRLRICILNDFTVSNFEITQLSSFNIPQYNGYQITPSGFCKNPTEGKYFMTYVQYNNSYDVVGRGCLEFVNNVGSSNEWNFYPYSGNKNIKFSGFQQAYPIWQDSGLSFTVFTDYEITQDSNNNTIGLIVLKNGVVNENKVMVEEKTISLPTECKNIGQIVGSARLYNKVIFSTTTNSSTLNVTTYVIMVDISTENFIIFETYEYNTAIPDNSHGFKLLVVNNQFYYFDEYITYDANFDIASSIVYFKQIFENKKYQLYEYENTTPTKLIKKIYSTNLYNLNEFGLIFSEKILQIKQIFNSNNYNGLPYEAPNSIVPNSGILYDDNDEIIFARNLYNKTVSGATTTSTVQIPNTLLNDVTIAKNNLIGQTNMELVNDTTEITKNIYETVDLNFSNTLIIRNDNDENNKILNPTGSSRLNNSVSQTVDYENAQATKLRVNYGDGTNEIIELSSTQIKLVSNYTAKYVFSVYVKKEITNIQIISYDENTVYQTINNLSLTVGKIYNFIQYVSMLEEIVRDEVLYNNEAINYNNEPVLYIN